MATLQRNLKLSVNWSDTETTKQRHRMTKIVCTIGPKTKSVEMLEKLMVCGMDVARLNFSHGTHEYHAEVIANVRAALKNRVRNGAESNCAIMLDTKGPEIRTGKLKDKTIKLTQGQEINITTDLSVVGDDSVFVIDYQELASSEKVGNQILVADGQISLSIKKINLEKNLVTCVVNNTSVLGENKNVHLPGAVITLPAVSKKDKEDLLFGVQQGVDMIAASFIRSPDDVRDIREILGEKGKKIKIISKIESTEGLERFDEILTASDGIMVARGDLGVELPMEQIFIAQKMMVSKCNAFDKPVITATQMLESMIQNPRPTRAEATDVANAVLDGTDCVMLSGETASGDYPLEAVTIMSGICKEAEAVEGAAEYPSLFQALRESTPILQVPEVVCSYAVRAANDLNAAVIVIITETGYSARLVCKYRPRVPVICITNCEQTANFLLVTRAAIPFVVTSIKGTEQLVLQAMGRALSLGLAKSGNLVVVVHGVIEGVPGNSNSLKVLTIP